MLAFHDTGSRGTTVTQFTTPRLLRILTDDDAVERSSKPRAKHRQAQQRRIYCSMREVYEIPPPRRPSSAKSSVAGPSACTIGARATGSTSTRRYLQRPDILSVAVLPRDTPVSAGTQSS